MEKFPLVSIIINSYNYGRFLNKTIDSALNQSYKIIEVIVVDDGSTDNSKKIILDYGNRITSILKENGGQGSAFNVGFTTSKGLIILFLDSDDLLLPTAVENVVQAFMEENIVKVDWPLLIIDENGEFTGERLPRQAYPNQNLKDLTIEKGPFYDWHITCPTSGNAWKRKFLEETLPMPPASYITCADEFLLTLAPIYGDQKRLNLPLGCYRSHSSNNGWGRTLSNDKLKRDMERFEVSCKILSRHLLKFGLEADPEDWKINNWNYLWMQKFLEARKIISSIVQPGESYIVLDDYDLGNDIAEDRKQFSFMEINGESIGHPENSEAAIFHLNSLKQFKPNYLIIWWTAFWWLDHYNALHQHLRLNFECLLENDCLIIFRLTD